MKHQGTLLDAAGKPLADPAEPSREERLKSQSLGEIARLIRINWHPMYFGAVPYVDAMATFSAIRPQDANYYHDSGESIVAYFLANAGTWRGDVAREVKAELKRRLKKGGR